MQECVCVHTERYQPHRQKKIQSQGVARKALLRHHTPNAVLPSCAPNDRWNLYALNRQKQGYEQVRATGEQQFMSQRNDKKPRNTQKVPQNDYLDPKIRSRADDSNTFGKGTNGRIHGHIHKELVMFLSQEHHNTEI